MFALFSCYHQITAVVEYGDAAILVAQIEAAGCGIGDTYVQDLPTFFSTKFNRFSSSRSRMPDCFISDRTEYALVHQNNASPRSDSSTNRAIFIRLTANCQTKSRMS